MHDQTSNQHILINLLQLTAKVQREFERKLSTHGIGESEFLILRALYDSKESINQIALADAVNLTPSGIARLINPMEKIHLVNKQKHPRDARMSMVAISEVGRAVYRDASSTFTDFSQMLCKPLSEIEQNSLLNLLAKL